MKHRKFLVLTYGSATGGSWNFAVRDYLADVVEFIVADLQAS